MSAPATTTATVSHRQVLEALSGLLLALFVAMLSSTVVSTALPPIIGALNGSQTQYTWVVTATLLTATATTPVWGKLADLFDKKTLVQIAIVIFVVGSVVSGFAQSAGQLIAARAFQGIGVGGAVFLGQYFQIGRGYSPTEAGLLTIPLMAGVLGASIVSGRLITKTGRIKPYIVAGAATLVLGFLALGRIDHETSLVLVGGSMLLVGVGVGMSMQNLVLAVQNTVPLKDIGAASSTIAFFRSLGGTIGVSVLGAVLARRVEDAITRDLAAAGIPAGGAGGGNLNLNVLPDAVQHIVRAAYGDATGHIFVISAAIAVVGVVAALLLKPITLRTSLDLVETPTAV
ncbi:MFS transporter [Saccharothrix deserti]|uniref:MFS transporter n=1 Tax=Saccharothrix deserti TaxID=2593674 RepID=UPI00131CEC53|nr:MFS transporter [Saccharothrix deserti]